MVHLQHLMAVRLKVAFCEKTQEKAPRLCIMLLYVTICPLTRTFFYVCRFYQYLHPNMYRKDVIVDLNCQLNSTWNHLGDTALGLYKRAFPGMFSW